MSQLGAEDNDGSARIRELKEIFAPLKDLDLEGKISIRTNDQVGFGASCDVFKSELASSNGQTVLVAVKRFRFFLLQDISFARGLQREVHLWSNLDHPNVLPLRGYFLEGTNAIPNLVSEWMKRGTLIMYMKDRTLEENEMCSMVTGIASGLNYIHTEHSMIHADLKGSNILVSDDYRPLLADFGLSFSSSSPSLEASTVHGQKGTQRWMAKELIVDSINNSHQKHSKMTDMWAFGMVIYELLSKTVPYERIHTDAGVSMAIFKGLLPDEPKLPDGSIFRDLWVIARQCWDEKPNCRPSASRVLGMLEMDDQKTLSPRPTLSLGRVLDNFLIWASAPLERGLERLVHHAKFGVYANAERNMSIFDVDDLAYERVGEPACGLLLEYAGSRVPAIQFMAFEVIVHRLVLLPFTGNVLREISKRHNGVLIEVITLAWKRHQVDYSDAWLHLYDLVALGLSDRGEEIFGVPLERAWDRKVDFQSFEWTLSRCRHAGSFTRS
ncbi:kinase-like protein [Schizopora paradoxa]|uniref:Kinase-like protein n=1 Tax=Schizopora paradoxa TaxID=27342 RepID=A0A0H2RCY3_9AGAM|nr:kinase-like protein [Schizopora paradoxa]